MLPTVQISLGIVTLFEMRADSYRPLYYWGWCTIPLFLLSILHVRTVTQPDIDAVFGNNYILHSNNRKSDRWALLGLSQDETWIVFDKTSSACIDKSETYRLISLSTHLFSHWSMPLMPSDLNVDVFRWKIFHGSWRDCYRGIFEAPSYVYIVITIIFISSFTIQNT